MRGRKPSFGMSASDGRTASGAWLMSGIAAAMVNGTKPTQHHLVQEHCVGSDFGAEGCDESLFSSLCGAFGVWPQQQPESQAWSSAFFASPAQFGAQQLAQLSDDGGKVAVVKRSMSMCRKLFAVTDCSRVSCGL
jgi:hypothetical protein